MAVVDIEPPKMAAAESVRLESEEAGRKIEAWFAEMNAAKAELDIARARVAELAARERALIHDRDQLNTAADHLAGKLGALQREHAHALGVTCDVCGERMSVTSSAEHSEIDLALALVATANMLWWVIGTRTMAAINAVIMERTSTEPRPLMRSAVNHDHDLCRLHRDHQP